MEEQAENKEGNKSSFNPLLIVGVVIILGVAAVALVIASKNNSAQPVASHETMGAQTQSQPTSQPTQTTPATQAAQADATATTVNVEGGNFYFKPNEIKVKKGQKVTINFTNAGGIHDFVIDEFNVKIGPITGGKTASVSFTPDKTGSFEFYCSIGNHRQMGMKGTLVVE